MNDLVRGTLDMPLDGADRGPQVWLRGIFPLHRTDLRVCGREGGVVRAIPYQEAMYPICLHTTATFALPGTAV